MQSVARSFFLGLGIVSVGLGVIGIFVPILPTTPFLLLAAFCFARSSERFLEWLLGHRWFGPYVRNYREHRGMAAYDKILTMIALWTGIGLSGYFAVSSGVGRAALVLIACAVTFHLSRIRTLRPSSRAKDESRLTASLPIDHD
jgi:uncharacterized membrane protein YbaN (DUF454 family)